MAAKQPGRGSAKSAKVTVTLDGDLARRLRLFATYKRRSMGSVVASALAPVLRGFVVGPCGVVDVEPDEPQAPDVSRSDDRPLRAVG
jgi:hypothetical protein